MAHIDQSHQQKPLTAGNRSSRKKTQWSAGKPLTGIVPPLVTPLANQNELDVPGLEQLIEHVLNGGVDGLFLLGTTGEAASLAFTVRRQLIQQAVHQVQQRLPVLVGVTDNAIAESISLAQYAAEAGADAVVVTAPCFFLLEQEELIAYVQTIARETPLPIFLYNMPTLTKISFDEETVRRLMDMEQVLGFKDSSGELDYLQRIIKMSRERADWSVLVGPENLLIEAIELGAHGCVGGGANVWPQLLVELYQAASSNSADRVLLLQRQLTQLHGIFSHGQYAAGSIRGLKCALELMGICSGKMAEPLAPWNQSQRSEVLQVLQAGGIKALLKPSTVGAMAEEREC